MLVGSSKSYGFAAHHNIHFGKSWDGVFDELIKKKKLMCDPSLLVIDHLYRLVGDNDKIERYRMIAPGNWSFFATSEWNRALRQGKITRIGMGPMHHTGGGGYLDAKRELPDGTKFVDRTVQVITEVIHSSLSTGQTL